MFVRGNVLIFSPLLGTDVVVSTDYSTNPKDPESDHFPIGLLGVDLCIVKKEAYLKRSSTLR